MAASKFVLRGKKNYPILFTPMGIAQVETVTTFRFPTFLSRIEQAIQAAGNIPADELAVKIGQAIGMYEALCLTLGGLEGYRMKFGSREVPYTLAEAGDIVDECGFMPCSEVIGKALEDFWPRFFGEDAGAAKKTTQKKRAPRKRKPTRA